LWKITSEQQGENPSVTLHYNSLDKEESYPGELAVQVTYTVSQDNELIIEYHATTTQDTIVNLTNHSYFNLNGHQSDVLDQELFINSKKILETTAELIPTGVFLDTINADMDFNKPKNCPEIIDNTFILNCNKEMAASLYSKENNLKMEVYTSQPAVHVYVGGNCLNSIKGKEGINYHSSSGICFETQNFPDAPNHKHFPNSVLKKGEVYYHKTIYKFLSL
jgi:aldose 1-epimerase